MTLGLLSVQVFNLFVGEVLFLSEGLGLNLFGRNSILDQIALHAVGAAL